MFIESEAPEEYEEFNDKIREEHKMRKEQTHLKRVFDYSAKHTQSIYNTDFGDNELQEVILA